MQRLPVAIGRLSGIVCSFFLCAVTLVAADFEVATRSDVLVLTSKIQAVQFLTHATFGPTESDVDALAARMRAIGTIAAASEWIDNQTNEAITPASSHVATLERMVTDDFSNWSITPAGPIDTTYVPYPIRFRSYAWWNNVIAGRDQLRQKTAWALAQIFPVHQVGNGSFNEALFDNAVVNGPQKSRYQGLSQFYDIFVLNAFGKYREVLGRVAYHPVMGDWLSYRGNRRAQGNTFPDENFAREVMQLFTIGLFELDDDGEQRKSLGVSIETYDADDVREYAQVFTGLGYGYGTYAPSNTTLNPFSPYSAGTTLDPNASVKLSVPMRMAPRQHDRSTKELLNGLTIPNPVGPNVQHTETSANTDIALALDGLVQHQSCPPFIARRLIQRMVKSNPSRAYIARVVTAFKGSGASDRGDLKKVIKAILLDPEAWQPIRVQYQRSPTNRFVVSTMGTEDSRLQEPILNYIRFTRFFKAIGEYQKANAGSYASPTVIRNEFRLSSIQSEFEQSPYEMPSVFNFYHPDYSSGDLRGHVASIRIPNGFVAAPELQLVNAITNNAISNFFRDRIRSGERVEHIQFFGQVFVDQYDKITNILESTRAHVRYDFSAEQALANSPTGIERLIERLDLYLCGGTLNSQFKAALRTALLQEITRAGGVGNVTPSEALDIAKGAALGIVTSPSFLVTE